MFFSMNCSVCMCFCRVHVYFMTFPTSQNPHPAPIAHESSSFSCNMSIYSFAVSQGGWRHVSLCWESRWTVHHLCHYHLYYLQKCDTIVPRGMGTKKESCPPPKTSHYFEWPASASSMVHSSLEIHSPRTIGESRGGVLLQIWLMQASREKSAGCGHFCNPCLLSNWRQ